MPKEKATPPAEAPVAPAPKKETEAVAEAPAPPKEAAPKPAPSRITVPTSDKPKETPSIFNRKKPKEEQAEEKGSVVDKRATAFSEEDLQRVWKQFAEQKKDAGDTDKLILNRQLTKGEEHKVVIHLASQLEVSFLEKLEVDLIQHLRSSLENDHVTLERDIVEQEETKKLYTSKDIFEHMVKSNPSLQELKDKLGLDFDY